MLLYGAADQRYSLENSLVFQEDASRPSWSAAATALWFRDIEFSLPAPLPKSLADGSLPRMRHTEELKFSQEPIEGGSWERSASLKHSTGISYAESGFIEAYIALGLSTSPLASTDENLSFYAFEAGIVAEFRF